MIELLILIPMLQGMQRKAITHTQAVVPTACVCLTNHSGMRKMMQCTRLV